MKRKTSILRICGIALAVLLLAGCNGSKGQEIDLAPDPENTLGTERDYSVRWTFLNPLIMPQKDTEDYRMYSAAVGEENCLPGRLYLYGDGSVVQLSDKLYREEAGVYNATPLWTKYIYAVCIGENGDYLMKLEQDTGFERVVYHAENNIISHMAANSETDADIIYFSAGDEIYRLYTETDEIELLVVCEGGVSDLVYRSSDTPVWSDSSGQYHIYNYETEEIEDIDYEAVHYFYELYEYIFHSRGDGSYDMYRLDLNTYEAELVLENITKIQYASDEAADGFVNYIFVLVEDKELGAYIASVDIRYGEIYIRYYAETEDMELIEAYFKVYMPVLYVREEENILRVKDYWSMETETLFRLENGLMESSEGEYEFYRAPFAENSRDVLLNSGLEIEGLEDFYICEECGDEYCIWADMDGNYFWYHPHSGENEGIEFIPVVYNANALILQKD